MLGYPVRIQPDGARFLARFPDVPEAITDGASREEALANASDALKTAMEFYFEDSRPVPLPSRRKRHHILIALPIRTSVKVLELNAKLTPMNTSDETLYQTISKQSEQLSYRNKFRLAQLLIQLARKEEEETYPQKRADTAGRKPTDPETIRYVAERIVKLHPVRKSGVLNAIGAMFQFQGGVSDQDKETIIKELVRSKTLAIDANGHVTYTHA